MKILFFNYCSIPILLIILFTTFIRKATKGPVNRRFIALTIITLLNTVIDIGASDYERMLPLTQTQVYIVTFFNYLYFLFRALEPLIYLYILFLLTRSIFFFRSALARFLINLPYIYIVIALVTNPLHHLIFAISPTSGYERGPLILSFYAVGLFYILFGCSYMIMRFRVFQIDKWIALVALYVLSIIAVLIQFLDGRILIEMFATSISLLLIALLVLRPEEITDPYVGLPSWIAYQNELKKITLQHSPVHILIMRYLNADQVRAYLGEGEYNRYISHIGRVFEEYCQEKSLYFDLYYEAPGTLYWLLDDRISDYNIDQELGSLEKRIDVATREFQTGGIKLDTKVCVIGYPMDLDNMNDIIHMGHEFPALIPADRRFVTASDIIGSKQYELGTNITSILNRAITSHAFTMCYQPIFSLRDRKFRSAEALIRLRDDSYGYVSPSFFIPAAESRGLIIPIGDYVLDSIFHFISENDLFSMGLQYIEINLSVAQCLQIDLPEKIFTLQTKYGVHPEEINFEITETTYRSIGGIAEENIRRLVEMGYKFSLDDYGTGYSNINRLVNLPLSIIKIDKTLVDALNTRDGSAIVRGTISMMKDIRKRVIAEGVETEEQLNSLMAMGCDYIQGFYFSKPLPQDEFLTFMKESEQFTI
ncbi:MAG: EAL domain-containing protein [Lachnospiraceae bacterium]|nr:EAL domain-containing protein [Lachnospiraceae bacterium]